MYTKELDAATHFILSSKPVSIKPITCGNINHTFEISLENGEKYTLQNINFNVFRKPYKLMENVGNICDFLKKKVIAANGDPDRETMTFITSDDGSPIYVDSDNRYWRMAKWIEAKTYQSITHPELFHSAGEAFGNFQSMLSDYPAETLHETIPNFHNTPVRYSDFTASVEGCKIPRRLVKAKAEIEFLESREPLSHIAVDAIKAGAMPIRVTHNDTKLNNVLIDAKTDKGICVIDLDTVMPGSVLYDFGDAIRFGACTAAEDESDTSKISLDLGLFEQFTRGFIKGVGGALTDTEYELLADGALLMTYELALRFLADYLNGDVYFKRNYPEHNIIRTRAQIALLKDMEEKLPDMKRIVRECRG